MRAWVLLFALIAALPARAAAIPLDEAGFGAYLQQKVQLYSPMPVRIAEPYTLAIGGETGVNLVYSFKALHDDCVAHPGTCDDKAHDFIQGIVSRFPTAATLPPPVAKVPSGQGGFMAYLAGMLGKKLPGARIVTNGLTLTVTRSGGRAIPFDESTYYKLCSEAQFRCDAALDQALQRTADWLAPPDRGALRISLHAMSCAGATCTVSPSPDAMAPFFRKAFANLEELCFKPGAGGQPVPLINADRDDMDLTAAAALDLCEQTTHAALGPVSARLVPVAPGEVGRVGEPYAASRALFPGDWTALAAGGHLIIALPNRDTLLYMTGDSATDIATLTAHAAPLFTGNSLAISADVYRWTTGGWVRAAP